MFMLSASRRRGLRLEPINYHDPKYPELKFYFADNLQFTANAICLYWINEIHVDSSLKGSPLLEDILKHEVKHYEFARRIISEKSELKRAMLLFKCNLWDFLSTLRIALLLFLSQLKGKKHKHAIKRVEDC